MEDNEPTTAAPAAPPPAVPPPAVPPPAVPPPAVPPPVDTSALLMGLDELDRVAKRRLLTLSTRIGRAAAADEAARKAVSDARAVLQEAIGADQRARQSVATSSTRQEYTSRAQVARGALEAVVRARIALQDAVVVQFRRGWQLAWLRQRSNIATSDAAGVATMLAAATTAAQGRKALVDSIDDVVTWRQNLLDKLADKLPPVGDRQPTVAEALQARSASLRAAPAGSAHNPSQAIFDWADQRFQQLPPLVTGPGTSPPPSGDLPAAIAAVDRAAGALARVQPAIRARLERAAATAAQPGPVGFGLSLADFGSMATALAQDPAKAILDRPPPTPPSSLVPAFGLLSEVPPVVWSLSVGQIEADRALAEAMATDGKAEREAFVEALDVARTEAADRADAIRAAEAHDDPPPAPPAPDLVEAFRAAMPFPYGLS